MSTLCPHCGAHHGFGAAQLEGHGTMKSDPNIQRIADLERQLAEAKAEVEAMRRLAYQAGYARGHDDTVEGAYNGACEQENDCADDWYRDYESRKQP